MYMKADMLIGMVVLFGVLVGVAATKFSLWIAVPMFVGMSIVLFFLGVSLGIVQRGNNRLFVGNFHAAVESTIRVAVTRVANRLVEEFCQGSEEQREEGEMRAQLVVDDELRSLHQVIQDEGNEEIDEGMEGDFEDN